MSVALVASSNCSQKVKCSATRRKTLRNTIEIMLINGALGFRAPDFVLRVQHEDVVANLRLK